MSTGPVRHQVSLGDLLDKLHGLIADVGDHHKHGGRRKNFTRDRALTLPVMVGLILTMVSDAGRLGYRLLIHKFWTAAMLVGIPLSQKLPVDGSAFCKARQKLPWQFFETLFEDVAAKFVTRFGSKLLWKGRRLLAVDGVKLTLPRAGTLNRVFGRPKGALRPMVAAVTIFDVLARVSLGVAFGRYASGEIPLFTSIIDRVPAGSILLLDRGFPGFNILAQLRNRGVDFVARTPRTLGVVKRFLATGRTRGTITLTPSTWSRRANLPATLDVRIERVQGGKDELILLTSLSRQVASPREVLELYRSRWNIETEFRVLKVNGFGEDAFHSRSFNGVKQEVCARLLFLNLARCLLAESAVRNGRPITDLAPKGAQAMLAHTEAFLVLLFRTPRTARFVQFAMAVIARAPAERRKGRHFPRVSHRPQRKWGPHGSTGRWSH
jgi:hypothetical protein